MDSELRKKFYDLLGLLAENEDNYNIETREIGEDNELSTLERRTGIPNATELLRILESE